jgi:hypothetical protein
MNIPYHTHISNPFFQLVFIIEYLRFLSGVICGQQKLKKENTVKWPLRAKNVLPSQSNQQDAFLIVQSLLPLL